MLYDVLMYYTLYLYIVIDISLAIWRLICTKTTFLIVTITFYTKWIHVNLFHQLCISTHWKRPWCWEGLGAEGKGDNRGWDGWKASPTRWMWVSVNSGSWWWTGRPGVLQFMGSQSVGHDWASELNWTEQWRSVKNPTLWRWDPTLWILYEGPHGAIREDVISNDITYTQGISCVQGRRVGTWLAATSGSEIR